MSTTSHPVTHQPNGELETRPRGIPGLPVWQALVGAGAASAITWLALVPLAGLDLAVRTGGEQREIGLGSAVVTALVVALGALGCAAVLRRLTTRPRRAFLWTCTAVLALSVLGPLGAVGAGAELGLGLLHLVVAAAVVPIVAGRLTERR